MGSAMTLPTRLQQTLDRTVGELKRRLGENLHSLVLYGSAAKETAREDSDLNLLIVLEESTPEAHAAIAETIRGRVRIEPVILGRRLLERSLQAFAVKFLSIRRHRRVLHGADPLADIRVPEEVGRFLAEQAVRNLHLRLVHAYVTIGDDRHRYGRYLVELLPALFTDLGEAIRQSGSEVPEAFSSRVPLFTSKFDADASVLLELLALHEKPRTLKPDEVRAFHARLFRLLEATVRWMEAQWPPLR